MGDYAITAANVLASVSARRIQATVPAQVNSADAFSARPGINTAGAVITAGVPVYQDPTTQAFYPADANGASPLYDVIGIAENHAEIGQPVSVVFEDPFFTPGCTMAIGDIIILSGTVGRICPAADLASGWFASVLMVAYTTTKANLKIVKASAAKS